jgi:alcohol dehydrogenase (NADP+)
MDGFEIAKDGINPDFIPKRTLYTGAEIPGIGIGTFGSDRFSSDDVAAAVKGAISVGYRHIDCASVYGNEEKIGRIFKEIQESGLIKREELWVTSKVWNDMHEKVVESCEKSLTDLQLDYLDLYLVHWPFPNHHVPGCDITWRSPDAKSYIHENYMRTWCQMERLIEKGLVKHIGISNMTIPKIKLLLRDAKIRPACNEMELHPHFQQPELFKFCLENQIQPIGYCPIGSPNRPERDRTEKDSVDIEDPLILKISQRLNVHPAVVCVKWAVQRGQIPIPFSIDRNKYLSNLKSTVCDLLTAEEMQELSKIDKNCRLIKGDVFLWKADQTWEALWDINGEITPA